MTNPLDVPADLLVDVDDIPWPANAAGPVRHRPLPRLSEPANMPATPVPAARDQEPLVDVTGGRVTRLHPYAHWDAPAVARLRGSAARHLTAASRTLPPGFTLVVLDAWRPPQLQAALHAAATADPGTPAGSVAEPSDDPGRAAPHTTGGTVDVTLAWHGQPLALGTRFDEFTPAAHTAAYETTPGTVRDLRRLLYWTMRDRGFVVIAHEWWHYEIGTRRWAALTGQPAWYTTAAR